MTMSPCLTRTTTLACAVAIVCAGCAGIRPAPAPEVATAATFKETPPGWIVAAPADALERGPWWTLFGDAQLDALVQRVEVSNQNVAAAAAAYAQARALVREQRASLFPTLSATGDANRAGGGDATSSGTTLRLGLGASWEPDVW